MKSLASSASSGARPDDLAAEPGEERRRPVAHGGVVGADDLGQRPELLESVALGDPLRAEGDVDAAAAVGERLGDVGGGPRVDGAAQDNERAVAEVRRDLLDGPLEEGHRRAEELVDRRPDDDDEASARPTIAGSAESSRRPVGRTSAQQLVGATLAERHLPAPDPLQRGRVRVEDAHPQTARREGEAQREADVAAAAQDDEVEIRVAHGRRGLPALRVRPTSPEGPPGATATA